MMRESLFPWKFGRFALVAVTLVLFLAAGDRQGVQAATTAQAIPGTGSWRIGSHDLDLGQSTLQLGRYSVVVLNAWQSSWVPAIHADSPGTRVLMYTTSADVSRDCDLASEELTCQSGVTMYDVNTNDASWILTDASGNRIVNAPYPYLYLGDVGSATFRSKWVSHVTNQAKTLGFDGVSIDSVLASYGGLTGGVVAAKYPTQDSWRTAMAGFIAAVGPALKAQGLYVAGQAFGWDDSGGAGNNDGSFDVGWWQQLAPNLSALLCEYFEQNANNTAQMFDNAHQTWTGNWDGWLKLVDAAQNGGADFFGMDYVSGTSNDVRNMTYGKASFLLKWNGKGGAYFWDYYASPTANNPWDPNWTMDIGSPTAAMYAVGSGAFRRDYTAGTVIVNPTLTSQTFSLGGTYTTASGASVTSVTLAPTSAAILHSTSTATPPASAPSNTSLPVISGTARVGSQLSGSTGSWSGSPTSYSYQWEHCDTTGFNCTAISGATSSSYTLVSADQGFTIRFVVIAANSAGSTGAVSAATGLVQAAAVTAPANTSLPVISGTAQQGQTLTASQGAWSGTPTSYAYQWQHCDSAGANCAAISGATSSSYTLASADSGATIRVAVTASNGGGSTTAVSAQTGVVAAAVTAPANTSLPVISGTAQVGSQLSGSTGSWSGSPSSYSYQWEHCDTTGFNCNPISGATNSSYLLVSADQGFTIRFVVIASNSAGSTGVVSAATGLVQAATVGAPANTSLPVISGTAQQGQTLTASQGAWSGTPTSYTYQWQHCDSAGANCAAISGATGSSYLLPSADQGAMIRVAVTATNSAGSTTAVSAQTGVVVAAVTAPANTSLPVISGTARQGQLLTASAGTWSSSPTSYAYNWLRCDSSGANCAAISGATSSSYTLVSADVGSTIRVRVIASNSGGSTAATSAPTAIVTRGKRK